MGELDPRHLGADALEDPDSDLYTNAEELYTHGTNPLLADTDADGLADGTFVTRFDTIVPPAQEMQSAPSHPVVEVVEPVPVWPPPWA